MKEFFKRLIANGNALQTEEPELKDYGITVELTIHAYSAEEAQELAEHLMEYGELPGKAPVGARSNTFWDIERVIEL